MNENPTLVDLLLKMRTPNRDLATYRFPQDLGINSTGNVMRISINVPSGSHYLENGDYKAAKTPEGEVITPQIRRENSTSLARRYSQNYTRTTTSIDLYMPHQIGTAYGTEWNNEELGSAGMAADAFSGASGIGDSQGMSDAWKAIKNTFSQAGVNALAGTGQTLTPFNAESLRGVIQNSIPNPYVEVLFSGVQNRTFSFTFKMIPRNQTEQQTMKDIIQELKFHSLPELQFTDQSNYWLFPSEFDIQFFNRNGENPWLFSISTCAMTNIAVNYTPEGNFAAHEEGAPFAIELTMEFMELEQLTKARQKTGNF